MQGRVYHYTGAETNPLALWRSLNLEGDAWGYGWSGTAMYLPNRLEGDLPDADWERLSLFCEQAELRLLARGGKPIMLLLTESVTPSGEWHSCGEYETCAGMHLLLGDPPKSTGSETTTLADVAYPSVFDYGVSLAPSREATYRVVAHTRHYYDSLKRLCYIRYASISTEEFQQ